MAVDEGRLREHARLVPPSSRLSDVIAANLYPMRQRVGNIQALDEAGFRRTIPDLLRQQKGKAITGFAAIDNRIRQGRTGEALAMLKQMDAVQKGLSFSRPMWPRPGAYKPGAALTRREMESLRHAGALPTLLGGLHPELRSELETTVRAHDEMSAKFYGIHYERPFSFENVASDVTARHRELRLPEMVAGARPMPLKKVKLPIPAAARKPTWTERLFGRPAAEGKFKWRPPAPKRSLTKQVSTMTTLSVFRLLRGGKR